MKRKVMVSLQAPTSPNGRKTILLDQLDYSSNKRKKDDDHDLEGIFHNRSKPLETTKSFFEIELQLETPLPLEWQRCLDIQSGQIHFYNTRTHKRTTRDPRRSPEPASPSSHMSLELELNLPCDQSQRKNNGNDNNKKNNFAKPIQGLGNLLMDSSEKSEVQAQIKRCPSWLAFNEEDEEQEEMVATVCTRCHMLVMLCKSSPACPNCKFMHPLVPDQNSPNNNNNKLYSRKGL